MMTRSRLLGLLVIMFLTCHAERSDAGYIQPVSVTGSGSYNNNASLIIDGFLPPRGTLYTATPNVYWSGTSTTFTIDLGRLYNVANLIVAIDNNDDYQFKSSSDGITFSNLFTFLASDGPVTAGQGGTDVLTTDSSYPSSINFPGDSTTPEYVGRSFATTSARYLQVSASNGDGLYSIGEIDAYTATATAVPEPSSIFLTGTAVLAGLGLWSRRRRLKHD